MRRLRIRPVEGPWPVVSGRDLDLDLDPGMTVIPGGPPPARRIVVALGRFETRGLLRSLWLWAGAGLCLLVILSFAPQDAQETGPPFGGGPPWSQILQTMPLMAHPMVGMVVLASNRNTTRARRNGVEELIDTCPTATTTRTAGALCSAWVPVGALAIFVAAYLALVEVLNSSTSPEQWGPSSVAAANVLSTLVLGVGGVALGVALGRWVRIPLAPVVAVVVVGFVSGRLSSGSGGTVTTGMVLSTYGPGVSLSDPTASFTLAQAWLHVGWLVALTVVTGIVAVAPWSRPGADDASTTPETFR